MKTAGKYKALSVTVHAEMERALSAVCKKEIRDRKHTDLAAFAPEWSSALDSVYDSLRMIYTHHE
jgi:hypothetical protein